MRLHRCWMAFALTLAGIALPAYGQVPLEWKFKEGDRFYIETVTHLRQQMKVMGQSFDQDLEQTTVLAFMVQKQNADGSVVLKEKFESIKFKSGPGAVAVPDEKIFERCRALRSSSPSAPAARSPMWKATRSWSRSLPPTTRAPARWSSCS